MTRYPLIKVREGLFRGHEGPPPTPEQYQGLYEDGIRLVLCLCKKQPGEEEAARKAAIKFIYRPSSNTWPPSIDQLHQWLAYTRLGRADYGVLVHCHTQCDRTGAAIFTNDIVIAKMMFTEAYTRMVNAGHHTWFIPYWFWQRRLHQFAALYGRDNDFIKKPMDLEGQG